MHTVDRRGTVLATWGAGRGTGADQLFDPAGLAVDAGPPAA
jgi:hypothetical protein